MGRASNRKKNTSRQERLGGRMTACSLQRAVTRATDLPLLLTAWHEAGHAVAGLVMGHGVDYAEVHSTGEEMGGIVHPLAPQWYMEGFAGGPGGEATATHLRDHLDEEQRAYLEQRIVIDLAGPLAERRFQKALGVCVGPVGRGGLDESDAVNLRARLWVLNPADEEAVVKGAFDAALALVDTHWSWIEQVAWGLHDAVPCTTPDGLKRYRLMGAQIVQPAQDQPAEESAP